MSQLPEQQEGTPAAHPDLKPIFLQPEATPVRKRKPRRLTVSQAWDDIGPVHTEPSLPKALEDQRKGLAPGWTWRLTCGTGLRTVRENAPPPPPQLFPECLWKPEPDRTRTTVDVQVPVATIGLRCAHPDGRRAVAVWAWRSDRDAWAFDAPAYAWMVGQDRPPYACDATEWRDLVRWVPEAEVAA